MNGARTLLVIPQPGGEDLKSWSKKHSFQTSYTTKVSGNEEVYKYYKTTANEMPANGARINYILSEVANEMANALIADVMAYEVAIVKTQQELDNMR
jgi:hypothetical protein